MTGETVRLRADGVGVRQQDGEIVFFSIFFIHPGFFLPHKHMDFPQDEFHKIMNKHET